MKDAIEAPCEVELSAEDLEIARLRSEATNNEASALLHAAEVERKKCQGIIAELGAAIAERTAAIAEIDAAIAEIDAAIAEKTAEKDRLRALVKEQDDQDR